MLTAASPLLLLQGNGNGSQPGSTHTSQTHSPVASQVGPYPSMFPPPNNNNHNNNGSMGECLQHLLPLHVRLLL